MSVAAAAVEMPAGAVQRVEALPEALLAILGHVVDPKSLARAGAVGRAWREAAAANGESLWEHASASIPLLEILDILQEEYGIQALDSDNGDDDDDEDPNEGRLSYVHVLLLLLRIARRRATPSSPSAAPTPTTTSASFCRSPTSVPKRWRR